ncbi:DUF402 domain-containing protein [Spiroplasma diminutum]|uniref:Uncharacterized protein associated with RNAses G and E n=1 Tax=Spiroplasma diminutum CUAS-1 TaxID=1276221 RepID=S5LZ73_9MOLU|nr:DUF402 domain-containing protein [Spiroplasma diminutum]AGR41871.1 uncharacterized protein associated with RNAses G and E [Spiroplasma diminutum CUAS-1]
MKSKTGDLVLVHAYKHSGKLYRSWEKVIIFEETNDYLILINEEVLITEINGRKWKTNEPAIWFFFKEDWYNIICMFKERGINYYCNLASPYIFEEGTIKYIDYDLDFKIFNDYSYKILDLKEFNRNRIAWNYSREIVEQIWKSVDKIKIMIKENQKPFDHNYVTAIWDEYTKLKSEN